MASTRLKILTMFLLLSLLTVLGGCGSLPAVFPHEGRGGEMPAVSAGLPGDEAWLREPFYRWISKGGAGNDLRPLIDRELRVLRADLDGDGDPEYFAWVAVDRLNGLGILFDARGDGYEPVYEISEPIYQVAFHRESSSLVVSAGHGGTGLQQNWFRVIRWVDGGYREVWTGIERSLLFSTPPLTERYGSVTITSRPDDTWVLRHATTYALLNEWYGIMESRDRADEYLFGPGQDRFIPAGDIPGVGRHLILDREETFGEAVFGRIVGLDGDAPASVMVELVNSKGNVLTAREPEGAAGFLLMPPEDLAPGTYEIRLVRPNGEGKTVLDSVALVVRRR